MTERDNQPWPSEQLRAAGVFDFSQAGDAIINALGIPEGNDGYRGFEVSLLTSAEFGLLPSFLLPQTFSLPLRSPMSIPGWAGLASAIKGGCGLWRPYHHSPTSLFTFAGDAQKIAMIDGDSLLTFISGGPHPTTRRPAKREIWSPSIAESGLRLDRLSHWFKPL
jgi:hypothetical protein